MPRDVRPQLQLQQLMDEMHDLKENHNKVHYLLYDKQLIQKKIWQKNPLY